MKLRIRSLESRETLKIEIPSPSSLQDLKQAIAEQISISSETSLHLSLNRKNEIIASPIDTLNSLGIASGDLIYYTRNPNMFLAEIPIPIPVSQVGNQQIEVSNSERTLETMDTSDVKIENLDEIIVPHVSKTLETMDTSDGKIESLDASMVSQVSKTVEAMDTSDGKIGSVDASMVPQVSENLEIQESSEVNPVDTCEEMDAEVDSLDDYISSAPGFLQKVYKAEVGNCNNNKHKLLIIACHAALLEFGFVCVDSVTQKKIDGYHLPQGWDLKKPFLNVNYTLPSLVRRGEEVVETVILKLHIMGKFVCVNGSLNMKEPNGLKLDASRFVPSINYFCASNCDSTAGKSVVVEDESFHEREVFELWKTVKDRLAIPLSIDLCIKTGLELPPCFMRLPTEVKMKILELLPGIDIAKVSCLSSELRYLASNNDLWKQKCVEEYSISKSSGGAQGGWKLKYSSFAKKTPSRPRPTGPTLLPPDRRWPRPWPAPYQPFILGGERDRYPPSWPHNFIDLFDA